MHRLSLRPSILLGVVLAVAASCRTAPAGAGARGEVTALVGGTIYPTPGARPIRDGVVIVEGERVRAVGERSRVRLPASARVIDVAGRTIVAGLWNAHVHFLEPDWEGIGGASANYAEALLADRYTRFGFVHLFDIGSVSDAPLVLRRRIERGELRGPDILTTLAPFVPLDGTPRYVAPLRLPELHDAQGARDSVRVRLAQGADGIKLFAVPITERQPFPVLSPDIIRAVAEEAHAQGKLVFVHPTDRVGVEVSVEGGADVLAHPALGAGALPDSLVRRMAQRGVALIPTLALCEDDYGRDTTGMGGFVRAAQEQVRTYQERGGRILFGTDVGYIARYDPTREYELLAAAGLDFQAVLESLTTAPAEAFGRGERTGRLEPGFDADLVVVEGDPAGDIRALARVWLTMKRGRILWADHRLPPTRP